MINKNKPQTIFIGSSIYTLSAMHLLSNILAVFIEDNAQKNDVVNFCNKEKIKFHYVKCSSDILKVIQTENLHPDIIFVTNSSIILKQDLINKCDRILNFHNGDLATNRGANPIYHSIANKDDFMHLVCHSIESEAIDSGKIICEIKVPIHYDLDFQSNIHIIHSFSEIMVKHVISYYSKYGQILGVPIVIQKNSYKPRIAQNIKDKIKTAQHLSQINYDK